MNVERYFGDLMQIVFLVAAIIPHEVAHGYVAYKLGDPTARREHRLTLNPLYHIDLFGSLIFPLFLKLVGSPILLGWAKPVPFNPLYFKNMRRGIMLVGAAGPATNLLLGFVAGLFLRLPVDYPSILGQGLFFFCLINIVLAVFNLIPIPPLDGSRIVLGLLPERVAQGYLRLEPFGIAIVFALFFFGAFDIIIRPVLFFFLKIFVGELPM
jgi:Zn-dependent protease